MHYVKALTIAGSDSGGCAGIQADLKTFAALQCFGCSVVVALTAQNTQGVKSIVSIEPEFIEEQISAILEDMPPDAIKIGMLNEAESIEVISKKLKNCSIPIVLDPVMVATSGDRLLQEAAITTLKEKLIPLATLITPNLYEASILLGKDITCVETAARSLLQSGSKAVLLKGGETGKDCLATHKDVIWYTADPIKTDNTHGTGCTYSAAIAAELAKRKSLKEAIKCAKRYITAAIDAGTPYKLGKGSGPVHHFYGYWQ